MRKGNLLNTVPKTERVLLRHNNCYYYFEGIASYTDQKYYYSSCNHICMLFSYLDSFIILDFWQERNSYFPVTFLKSQEGGCCSSYEMICRKIEHSLTVWRSIAKPVTPTKALQKLFYRLLVLIFLSSLFFFQFCFHCLHWFLPVFSLTDHSLSRHQEHWVQQPLSYILHACVIKKRNLLNF